jgi:hypothetical protein
MDPDESVARSQYNEADVDELIEQFQRRIHRLVEALSQLDRTAADRTLTLGGQRISVALIARSAWHECQHHLGDIQRLTG